MLYQRLVACGNCLFGLILVWQIHQTKQLLKSLEMASSNFDKSDFRSVCMLGIYVHMHNILHCAHTYTHMYTRAHTHTNHVLIDCCYSQSLYYWNQCLDCSPSCLLYKIRKAETLVYLEKYGEASVICK